ncbi:MAG: DUF1211 domain-containing protein [Candidatus Eremiobacteraeota bacterium]|nr:DUF1211 domain-containing protein [Candidatus Eremiobacteraeota bacterium]
MRQVLAERGQDIVRGFRQRGHHHVSRIESFSDAVFGFSLTLLVVSLQVPRSFDELLGTVRGFPAFALSFMLLAQIWYLQYRFFRRYGLQDMTTIVLNMALLFTIMFFTYPLKFLFGILATVSGGTAPIAPEQLWQLFAIYNGGYAAVFAIFALLYRHALVKRDELELTPLELLDTRSALQFSVIAILVAGVSMVLAGGFSAGHAYALAGISGGLTYPIGFTLVGRIFGRKVKRRRAGLIASLGDDATRPEFTSDALR